MKKWLLKIRPPKYLRYLFFITYSGYRKFTSERSDAHNTAILFLAMLHYCAYLGLFFYFLDIVNRAYIFIILVLTSIQFYFWFSHKGKWKLFIEEFKDTPRSKQVGHLIYLLGYLFICLTPIFLPVLLDVI